MSSVLDFIHVWFVFANAHFKNFFTDILISFKNGEATNPCLRTAVFQYSFLNRYLFLFLRSLAVFTEKSNLLRRVKALVMYGIRPPTRKIWCHIYRISEFKGLASPLPHNAGISSVFPVGGSSASAGVLPTKESTMRERVSKRCCYFKL